MGTLGTRIKERRKALDLSQEALAKRVGADQSSISDLERGETRDPASSLLAALSDHLGVSMEWLWKGAQDSSAPYLRPDVLEVALKLQAMSEAELSTIRMAFGPTVPDAKVAKHIKPAPAAARRSKQPR